MIRFDFVTEKRFGPHKTARASSNLSIPYRTISPSPPSAPICGVVPPDCLTRPSHVHFSTGKNQCFSSKRRFTHLFLNAGGSLLFLPCSQRTGETQRAFRGTFPGSPHFRAPNVGADPAEEVVIQENSSEIGKKTGKDEKSRKVPETVMSGFLWHFTFLKGKNTLDMFDLAPMEGRVRFGLAISLTVCMRTIHGIIPRLLAGILPEEGSRGHAV